MDISEHRGNVCFIPQSRPAQPEDRYLLRAKSGLSVQRSYLKFTFTQAMLFGSDQCQLLTASMPMGPGSSMALDPQHK
jgi:hypothetical protein